jgi:hypothetical protein
MGGDLWKGLLLAYYEVASHLRKYSHLPEEGKFWTCLAKPSSPESFLSSLHSNQGITSFSAEPFLASPTASNRNCGQTPCLQVEQLGSALHVWSQTSDERSVYFEATAALY